MRERVRVVGNEPALENPPPPSSISLRALMIATGISDMYKGRGSKGSSPQSLMSVHSGGPFVDLRPPAFDKIVCQQKGNKTSTLCCIQCARHVTARKAAHRVNLGDVARDLLQICVLVEWDDGCRHNCAAHVRRHWRSGWC